MVWRRAVLVSLTIGLVTFGATGAVRAQAGGIDCGSFIKNADGSWTVIKKVFIPVQNVRVREGTVFRPGETFLGDDMAQRLAAACPNQPIAAPVGAPEPAAAAPGRSAQPGQPVQPGQVPLSFFADANGRLDVRQLTCAQIADAPADDAEVFLAWYGGWYSGIARRPGINLARVRYQARTLVDYCKGNRNKSLRDAMEQWLK